MGNAVGPMSHETISLTTYVSIHAPAREVWDVLVTPARWWDGVTFTPAVGSRFRETWTEDGVSKSAFGIVLAVSAPATLALRWKERDWPDQMTVTILLQESRDRTDVVLTESGWEMFPPSRRKSLMDAHRRGWSDHLADLKEAVEESLVAASR
ncbi:MAG TPA: SRPBCC domain-containing protein [Thermoanaerobaculia bacterium]